MIFSKLPVPYVSVNVHPPQVIVFGDACIMDAPVEDWPLCDCLVAFYSTGFPSDKAEAYVKLRRPYALNNLEMQDVLHDRRRVRGGGAGHKKGFTSIVVCSTFELWY